MHSLSGAVLLWVLCVYIRQNTLACIRVCACVCVSVCVSKIHPNLKATAQLAYIVTDADCDYGCLF